MEGLIHAGRCGVSERQADHYSIFSAGMLRIHHVHFAAEYGYWFCGHHFLLFCLCGVELTETLSIALSRINRGEASYLEHIIYIFVKSFNEF